MNYKKLLLLLFCAVIHIYGMVNHGILGDLQSKNDLSGALRAPNTIEQAEVLPAYLYEQLRQLPTAGKACSVLEKNAAGSVWVNKDGRFALIRTDYGFTFLVGTLTQEDVKPLVDFLSTVGRVSLICDIKYHYWFIKQGFSAHPRAEFIGELGKIHEERPVSGQFVIEPITAQTFKRCNWTGRIALAFGSEENFLSKGFGFIVRDGDIVVSEVFAAFIGNGACELGAVSHPEYRDKGLTTLLLQRVYNECARRGLRVVASCDVANVTSFLTCSRWIGSPKYYVYLVNSPCDVSYYARPVAARI